MFVMLVRYSLDLKESDMYNHPNGLIVSNSSEVKNPGR